jgi:hypothetical protein
MAVLSAAITATRSQSPMPKYAGLRPATPTRMGRQLTPSRAVGSHQQQATEKRPPPSSRQGVTSSAIGTTQLLRTSDADCFSTLGLSPLASASEIRQAYRSLAKKYHPDVNPDSESSLQFVRLRSAYEMCLMAEASRDQQQLHGASPLRKMSRTTPTSQRPSPMRTRRTQAKRDAWDDIWDEMLSSPKQSGRRRRSTS